MQSLRALARLPPRSFRALSTETKPPSKDVSPLTLIVVASFTGALLLSMARLREFQEIREFEREMREIEDGVQSERNDDD